MSVIQTLLVFLGIPLGVILLVSFAVFGRSTLQAPNRYRPGKAWSYAPAWYLPHPDALTDAVADRIPNEACSHGTVVGLTEQGLVAYRLTTRSRKTARVRASI